MLALSSQLYYQSGRSNDSEEGIYGIIPSICHLSQVVFHYWCISVLKTSIHASSIQTIVMNSQEHAKSLFYGKDIRKDQEIQADTQVYSACMINPKSQRWRYFLPCKYREQVLVMGVWEKILGSASLPKLGRRSVTFLGLQRCSSLFYYEQHS